MLTFIGDQCYEYRLARDVGRGTLPLESLARRDWLTVVVDDQINPKWLKNYIRKDREGNKDIIMTPQRFDADYNLVSVVNLVVLRGV